jgi:gluconate 5-dehydrogenase
MTVRTVQQLFDLKGKTALVTGGSRGLGLQMAHALGEAGARLVISSRKADDLAKAAAELKAVGIDAQWIAADASRQEDIARLTDEALQKLGHVDILVNNAGATWGSPAEDYPLEAWDKVMNLNVRGYFLLCQQLAKKDMLSRGGSIINISSVAGLNGGSNVIAYNTSKAAVLNFTRSLAREWGPRGIRVNAICPGAFPTKMMKGTMEKGGGADAYAARTPLRRIGDDEDLKGITVLFASDAGKHITGQWMAVDGGSSA